MQRAGGLFHPPGKGDADGQGIGQGNPIGVGPAVGENEGISDNAALFYIRRRRHPFGQRKARRKAGLVGPAVADDVLGAGEAPLIAVEQNAILVHTARGIAALHCR